MAMSSDGTDEVEEFTTRERTNGWRVLDPERWSNNRLTQIHESLEVFHQNGFITQDGVKWGVRAGGSMLGVVVADPKACETKAMACPSYWAIHLCQIAFSRRDNGDGFKVSSRHQEELDRAVECWSMENMHKVLLGDKSKSFKDVSKGGEFQTEISSQAARKNKIPVWALRGDARRKRLDVRPLGDESQQIKKTASFFEIFKQAGLDEDNPVDPRIVNRQPPDTHMFQSSGSARERMTAHALAGREAMLAMKSIGKQVHGVKRSGMGAVRNSSVLPRTVFHKPGSILASVKKTGGLSMGSTERYTSSRFDSDSDSDPLHPELDTGNGMMPIARKKYGISRNGAVDEVEVAGPVDKAEVPSDDEEDVLQDKEDSLKEMISSSAGAPNRDSDKDSEEEMDDELTGPREEGAVTISEESFDEKFKAIRGISISDNDRDKIRAAIEARDAQKRGERLTQGQCRLIVWFSRLDPDALKEGELKKKKPTLTPEQIIKRKQEAADKKRKQQNKAALKEAREAYQVAILEEREERKLANRKRKQEEEEAKEKKRQEKNEAKMNRGNDALKNYLEKKRRQESEPKMKMAKKRNVVQTGEFSLKIVTK